MRTHLGALLGRGVSLTPDDGYPDLPTLIGALRVGPPEDWTLWPVQLSQRKPDVGATVGARGGGFAAATAHEGRARERFAGGSGTTAVHDLTRHHFQLPWTVAMSDLQPGTRW